MTNPYASLIATAKRLIKAKGASTTLTRVAVSAVDTAADTDTATPSTYTIDAVGIPPSRSAEYRIGSLVNRNLMEFYMTSDEVTPDKGDSVLWLGQNYKLIWVNVLNPNAQGTIFTQAYGEA